MTHLGSGVCIAAVEMMSICVGRGLDPDQIEAPHEYAIVGIPAADHLETGNAVSTARHRLPVNDAGPRAQSGERIDDPVPSQRNHER
jgi:hypothetical protein